MLFVNALPTLVWGRNVASARLGFLLPAIFGLCLLYAALRAWDEDVPGFRYVALLAVVALPTFPILTLYFSSGGAGDQSGFARDPRVGVVSDLPERPAPGAP